MSAQYNPQHQLVKEALLTWADKYNVNYNWVLKAAYRTMRLWRSCPELSGEIWSPLTKAYWPEAIAPQDPAEYFQPWRPVEESRSAYRKRILVQLDTYLDEQESTAQKRGFAKTKLLKNTEQFKWLAMWWFCGISTEFFNINYLWESIEKM